MFKSKLSFANLPDLGKTIGAARNLGFARKLGLRKELRTYRRFAVAGAALCTAVSAGFLMKSSEPGYAAQTPPGSVASPVSAMATPARLPGAPVATTPGDHDLALLPSPPEDMPPRADLPDEPVVLLVSRDLPVGALPREETTPQLECDSALIADASAAAMVRLSLSAPCQAGERVTFHHGGLKFTEIVGGNGRLDLVIPALGEQAVFVVTFANGEGVATRTEISSLSLYDRVAVQTTGDSGVQLHALEFDADYGSAGHVWRDQPRDVTAVAHGSGGFLTRLGNPDAPEAAMAEVYTFPSRSSAGAGLVRISLEAEIGRNNCARDVSATTFELRQDGGLRVREVSLSVPDCDAAGEFLVLKNLMEDLTIAAN
ncbi:hypothetical protein [Shimia sp.]|uniref:hypothetical protein n=1 Tax=Shimia sp. TaxID=1954381 RepID=UPI003564E660